MELRYGCVGAGSIARKKHIRNYKDIEGIKMVAVCDSNIEKAKELIEPFGFKRVYSNYIEMLEKEKLDFISVCTPNAFHAPVTIAALNKGIHVHCEKPIALNADEAQAMVDAKNKSGKILMIGLNNRFSAHAEYVNNCIKEGLLGDIYHAKCGRIRRRGIPGKGGWFTNKDLSGGGPLIDLGVHYLDLTMHFMGFPKVKTVSGMTYSKFMGAPTKANGTTLSCDVEDFATGFIRLENDCSIDINFSWASNIEKESSYYELLGTKGGLSFKNDKMKVYTEQFGSVLDISPHINNNSASGEMKHFIDCIKNSKNSMSPPEDAVIVMKIIDGIYKSSELKKEIEVVNV